MPLPSPPLLNGEDGDNGSEDTEEGGEGAWWSGLRGKSLRDRGPSLFRNKASPSIVKSQYGVVTAGSTACSASSKLELSAKWWVKKPLPSCQWSHPISPVA